MRLQLVLPNIINDDQSGYLKSHYIGQNIRILEDCHFLTSKINYQAYYFLLTSRRLLTLWNFLYKTLANLNFGVNFIGYVKTMYNSIEFTILNNGNTGIYFKLQR